MGDNPNISTSVSIPDPEFVDNEQEISDAVIDAAIAAAEHQDECPQAAPDTDDQPAPSPDEKPKSSWGQLLDGVDDLLIRWRDKQVDSFPDAELEGILDEGVYNVQKWRDDLVRKRTGTFRTWGDRASSEMTGLGLSAGKLVRSRNKALAEVSEIRARSEGNVGSYDIMDSRPDLLLVSPCAAALEADSLDVQTALSSAGTPFVVIDGAEVGEMDAFYDLFEKCGADDGAFAAGTLIIKRLDRMPFAPASIEQLRRYSFAACKDESLGYWNIPAGARATVAVYATYLAPSEEAVPRIIRECFKKRLVIRGLDHASEEGRALSDGNEASQ